LECSHTFRQPLVRISPALAACSRQLGQMTAVMDAGVLGAGGAASRGSSNGTP